MNESLLVTCPSCKIKGPLGHFLARSKGCCVSYANDLQSIFTESVNKDGRQDAAFVVDNIINDSSIRVTLKSYNHVFVTPSIVYRDVYKPSLIWLDAVAKSTLVASLSNAVKSGSLRASFFSTERVRDSNQHFLYHFTYWLSLLGFKRGFRDGRDLDYIILPFINMDAIFDLNYRVCGRLEDFGLISSSESNSLSNLRIHTV